MEVVLLRLFGSDFLEDEYHIKSEVIRQCLLQKLSENEGMQKPTRTCRSDSFALLTVFIFSVCSISLVASILHSIDAKLSIIHPLSERVMAVNMQGLCLP